MSSRSIFFSTIIAEIFLTTSLLWAADRAQPEYQWLDKFDIKSAEEYDFEAVSLFIRKYRSYSLQEKIRKATYKKIYNTEARKKYAPTRYGALRLIYVSKLATLVARRHLNNKRKLLGLEDQIKQIESDLFRYDFECIFPELLKFDPEELFLKQVKSSKVDEDLFQSNVANLYERVRKSGVSYQNKGPQELYNRIKLDNSSQENLEIVAVIMLLLYPETYSSYKDIKKYNAERTAESMGIKFR